MNDNNKDNPAQTSCCKQTVCVCASLTPARETSSTSVGSSNGDSPQIGGRAWTDARPKQKFPLDHIPRHDSSSLFVNSPHDSQSKRSEIEALSALPSLSAETKREHALVAFKPQIARMLSARKLAIFLDYDGTLSPIVDLPQEAVLSTDTRRLLERLATRFPVAIVTGRPIPTILDFVKLQGIYYAANHGFDIIGPDGKQIKKVAEEHLPALASAFTELSQAFSQHGGMLVENNSFSVSVHYRRADPAIVPEVERIVDEVVAKSPGLKKTHGKKVFEVRPNVEWHKGKAVQLLLEHMQKNCSEPLLPVYMGDDITDEDALSFISSLDRGLGVSVQYFEAPRPTAGQYVVYSTEEVKRLLAEISKLPAETKGLPDILASLPPPLLSKSFSADSPVQHC